ncbi:hypothetical protein GALMADRAFT_227586 [Galerina marginata CBS 339.88]|uniref:HMG box domain-containing protein n=1 Tax=Galerina marginata (strain CBS 339.88) TaxID=685588 RepID=A0A067T3N3_GALM3|nr:hypothetical protein GALMADRAFT_227586 [Galerina marginata CBS 339.88]
MSSKFDFHRTKLEESLTAVADSMRNCAQVAEAFAKIIKDSQEAADLLHGASDDHAKGKRKAALSPEDGDGPKKRKRNVKPKDPNAPKRPASSYILFQNEVRKELKEQHPTLSNSDLLGLISEQWKNMSDAQKETYNNAMKTAKAQYSEEKKAYDNRTPEEIESANVAAAAALKAKKANAKPRGPKPAAAAAVAAATAVKARPPPTAEEAASPSSDSSEEDDSDDEEVHRPAAKTAGRKSTPDTESSSEEEEEEEKPPAPKKRRGASVQPKEKEQKSKKNSRA